MDKDKFISYDELIENFLKLLDVAQGEEENEKENKQ